MCHRAINRQKGVEAQMQPAHTACCALVQRAEPILALQEEAS